MIKDPIIDDVRAVRHKISERFAHDSDRLIDYLIEKEKKLAKNRHYHFIGRSSSIVHKCQDVNVSS